MAERKKVLITGVAGFIGSNLADRLIAENCPVVGLDNLAYGVREQVPAAVEFHKLDIRSKDIYPMFKGIDTVFHLAAKNCISDCQHDPIDTADINITGTVNVFEAARQAGVRKVIYAESSALYEGSKIMPTPESEVKPQSFYAISKLAGMHLAAAYQRYYGLNLTGLRYFCVYGPRQDYRRTIPPVMSAFIIKLLKDERPVIYGTGKKRRDFVYIDDINDFHLHVMTDERAKGQVYNLGSGINHSVNEIFDMIKDRLHSQFSPVYRPDLPGEALETLADITKAKALGWRPKTDIAAGLDEMIKWIKENVI